MKVDIELLARYDQPGPRYTSYPTAVEFTDAFGPSDAAGHLEESNQDGRPISLYVHQPYCRSLCWFCACSVVITNSSRRLDDYLDLVEAELGLVAPRAGRGRPLVQLHWGGGTPSYLSPAQTTRLMSSLTEAFPPLPDAELSVEVDPRELDQPRLEALAEAGFTRISMGIQDFDETVQASINRVQSEEVTRWAVETARGLGFASVNLDLVYGLPHQTAESFAETVDTIVDLAPQRIALYSFAYLPWLKKHHTVIDPQTLPAPGDKLGIFKMAIERLTGAGYRYLGMDHFAHPDDELSRAATDGTLQRNFQGYSTRAGHDLVGLGMTAIGQTDGAYSQNHKTLTAYRDAIHRGELPTLRGVALTADDRLRRHVIMELMCRGHVRFDEIEAAHDLGGMTFEERFAPELRDIVDLETDGLVRSGDRELRLTESGRLLVRNVAMTFDVYRRQPSGEPRFSKTI